MKYEKFAEYLDRNNKLKTSGTVKQIADFEGKVDVKPAKEKKHKDAGGKGQSGEVKPYKGGTDAKDPNKGKMGDGFAHKGDAKLKYEPKTDVPAKVGAGGKTAATWPKTKTQEWVDGTKGMSLAEFTKKIRSEALKGLDECACQEAPHNSIKETISICKCNQGYISALVREMKRNGLFGKLVKEMVNHPETFKALAILMERDESYIRQLNKAMNEMIAPPMGDDAGGDIGGPPMHKMKKKKPFGHPDDMAGLGDDEENPDDMDMDDLGGEEDDGMGDIDDMGDVGDESGDDLDDDQLGDTGEDDPMNSPDDSDSMDAPEDAPLDMPPPKKRPKAHLDLLSKIKNHPAMGGGGM